MCYLDALKDLYLALEYELIAGLGFLLGF